MSLNQFLSCRFYAVLLIVVSLVLEPGYVLAAPVKTADAALKSTRTNRVPDIALKAGGVLQGQVLNHAGAGEKNIPVSLSSGKRQWQTKTDADGWFRFAELCGGNFQFHAGEQTQNLRAWAPGTAPPHANQGLLVAPTKLIVRGQRVLSPNINQFFRVAKDRLSKPLVVGGVIVTAVAIPVAIHNTDDDDPPATP